MSFALHLTIMQQQSCINHFISNFHIREITLLRLQYEALILYG